MWMFIYKMSKHWNNRKANKKREQEQLANIKNKPNNHGSKAHTLNNKRDIQRKLRKNTFDFSRVDNENV